MRIALISAVALSATCLSVSAQQDHWTSSPRGYETREGNSSQDLIGKESMLRYQQVNSLHEGSMSNRNRIAFRRDGVLADNTDYGARNIELELTMSEADYSSFGTDFAANMTGNTMTVITRKTISMPDWTFAPASGPAPADGIMLFDNPVTWNYPGASTGADYLFDIKVWSNDQAGMSYPMDGDGFIHAFTIGASARFWDGPCVSTGQTSAMQNHFTLENHLTHFETSWDIKRGVPGNPAVLMVDATLASFMLPGACDTFFVVGGASVPVTLDANGDFYGQLRFPYDARLIGLDVHTQGFCPDAAKPWGLSLSYGRTNNIPGDPTGVVGVRHAYALDPDATTATSGVQDGGVVLWTNHT
ncbi:MAG: hypothetical protein AAF628_19255 [Planctomycetota bacterium]